MDLFRRFSDDDDTNLKIGGNEQNKPRAEVRRVDFKKDTKGKCEKYGIFPGRGGGDDDQNLDSGERLVSIFLFPFNSIAED